MFCKLIIVQVKVDKKKLNKFKLRIEKTTSSNKSCYTKTNTLEKSIHLGH